MVFEGIDMAETVSVDIDHSVIFIQSSDIVSIEDLSRSLQSVQDIFQTQGINKILVDATKLNKLPSLYLLHAFAEELSKSTISMKHAIVVSDQTPSDVKYLETVAVNRSVYINIFHSHADALFWLKE
jgi:hypothetical protein